MAPTASPAAAATLLLVVCCQLLVLAAEDTSHPGAAAAAAPSAEFSRHAVARPRFYHGGGDAEISHTRRNDTDHGHHLEQVTVRVVVGGGGSGGGGGKELVLDLALNKHLIPDTYFEKFHEQGATKTNRYSSAKEVELCHYQGKVRGAPESWVAVSTCEDGHLRGVIFDGSDIHHVEPGFVYRHSDHVEEMLNRAKRSVSNEKQHRKSKNGPASGSSRNATRKATGIKGPWNANKRSRYVELLLVVDNKEFREHDSDLKKIQRICKDVANVMNSLYSPLNIYIALVGVVVWTEYDEITLSTKGDDTLTNFLHYRRERLVKEHPNDNAQLLTGIRFEGGVVGKALKGPMCTYEFSGGVNMWHSDVIGLVATTVAHEMGHNFGMEHDTEDCECPDDRCIMAPASSTLKPTFWSSCSLEYLALAFEHGMDYCLRNKPRALFDSPTCGNGFVEPGEECDCGMKHHCDNPCCNPDTCALHANASCASGECCDFATCRPKSPGSVCRRSDHECDLPEYCTGESEFCPADTHKVDGMPCKVGQAFCFEGACRTHSDQCKLLWGPSGKKSDNQCFEQNRKGTRHGNCGYNRLNGSYVKCNEENVRCGMLHCSHLNERLEFGMETVAILSHSFINHGGRIIPCRTALVDLGLNDVDPGLAPEGGRCGDGKMCVNRKCMPVSELKIGPHSCPSDCHGNGLCNSFGHCHCKVGYAPPDCLAVGPGGSVDSGPASNPEAASPATVFVIALATVLPFAVCAALFFYVQRTERGKDEWRRFMEKAKGDGGASPARKLEVGSPAEEKSNPPSPKVALLPRVDTTTTALGRDGEERGDSENEGEEEQKELTVEYKQGRMVGGLFSGGFSRSRLKRKRSTSDIESGRAGSGGGSKLAFMQNLARSITFPGSKSREQAKYEIKVEHRSSPRPSADSILSPAESPTSKKPHKTDSPDGNDDAAANKSHSETDVSMAESAATASPSSPSSAKEPTSSAETETSLSTTTASSPTKAKGKAPPPPRPPPRPSPAALAAKKPPHHPGMQQPPAPGYSSAVESASSAQSASFPSSSSSSSSSPPPVGAMSSSASMPLQQRPPAAAAAAESIMSNPKLAFPHSSSFNSSGVLRSPFLAAVAAKNAQAGTPPPPPQTTFSASNTTSTLSSKTADDGESASKFKSSRSAGSLSAKLNNTSTGAPLSAPALVKDGVDGSAAGAAADRPRITTRFEPSAEPKQQQQQQQEEERLSAYERAKAAAIPPPIPVKKPPSPTGFGDGRPAPTSPTKELGESRDTLTGSPVRLDTFGRPVRGSMTKTSTLPTSLATAAGNTSRMHKSSTLPVDGGGGGGGKRPEISMPILQTATPSASALIDRAPSTGISQTSILSTRPERPERRDKGARGVVFSDQLTLPSPTNPYNPPIIHQPSSIASSNQSTPEAAEAQAAAAAAVTITSALQMQQATTPPPVQKSTATTATVFTPTWSTEPKPLSSDAVICHIDGEEGGGGGSGSSAPMATPEVDSPAEAKDSKGREKAGGLSKFKAKLGAGPSVKRSASAVTEASRENTPERRQTSPTPSNNSQSSFQGPGGKPSLRNLEISGPILQSTVDIKTTLVPVCSLAGGSPMPPPTGSTTSPVPSRAAPPPPVAPRGHGKGSSPVETGAVPKAKERPSALKHSKSLGSSSKRPASIASTRPVRPTAPPPPRPPAEKPPPPPPAPAPPTTAAATKATDSRAAASSSSKAAAERPSSIDISSPSATDDGEFVTPTTSPLFERRGGGGGGGRKSPDTVSTASSEGDLLKEILKEMDGGPKKGKEEEEGAYSTLMRKKKRQQQQQLGEKQPVLAPPK